MISSIDEYLCQLKKQMVGCDRAIIQDALSDAEEHLRNALENMLETKPEISEADILPPIIEEYGTPDEVAAGYRETESRLRPSLAQVKHRNGQSFISRFFGVAADPRTWGAFLYLLFALVTGILYFTWAVTGISISIGLLVLIIGVPFAGLFILSVRGIALVEGRIVEALLGVRMPRRPLFSTKNLSLWGRFKVLISDKYTWYAIMYMILQLPLGVIYFSVFISLIAVSLYLIARPILELGFGLPVFNDYSEVSNSMVGYFTPGWVMPFAVVGGVLLLFLIMHLAKIVGKMHGALAKLLLVRE